MQTEPKTQASRLPHPVRLTEQVWPEGTVPVVSAFCITYNHEKFIRDAIEGFLMQETTFPVEIFIHDDSSTDSTADIVKEYAAKYPQLFWTVFQTENQWSKGNKKILFDYLAQQRGEFIALCEGDDYWTNSSKLERQVRALELNCESAFVYHRVRAVDTGGGFNGWFMPAKSPSPASHSILNVVSGEVKISTASLMFRGREYRSVDAAKVAKYPVGDYPIMVLACKGDGKATYLDDIMADYRRHDGGLTVVLGRQGGEALLSLANMWQDLAVTTGKTQDATFRKRLCMDYAYAARALSEEGKIGSALKAELWSLRFADTPLAHRLAGFVKGALRALSMSLRKRFVHRRAELGPNKNRPKKVPQHE